MKPAGRLFPFTIMGNEISVPTMPNTAVPIWRGGLSQRLIQINDSGGEPDEGSNVNLRSVPVPYSANSYESRADRCDAIAHQIEDPLLKRELLKLKETYRNIAACLRGLSDKKDTQVG